MERAAYETMAATEDEHWWFVGRRRILEREISRLALPPSAAIADFGAGTGGNLPMLRQFGNVSALEMDEAARQVAQAKSGQRVELGHLPDAVPFGDETFDLIGLFDVLEHIEQEEASLHRIRTMLKPGGALLVTVPAFQWLWSAHDEVLHHFRRYTKGTLEAAGARAGLKMVRSTYFNTTLFPVAAAIRLANFRSNSGDTVGDRLPPRPLNSLLAAVLRAEGILTQLVALPFGLSLLAVLRRT